MLKELKLKEILNLVKLLKKRKLPYFLGLLSYCLTETSIVIIVPFIMKYMSDGAVNSDLVLLKKGIILAIIEIILVCTIFVITRRIYASNAHRSIRDLRVGLFDHIKNLPIYFFENTHSGDIISRAYNDMAYIRSSYILYLRMILFLTISGIGAGIAMLILNWKIGVILIILGILSTAVNAKFTIVIRKITDKIHKSMGKLTESISDVFAGYKVIKMFHLENTIMTRFNKNNEVVFSQSMDNVVKTALLDSTNFLISWINFGGIIAAGSLLIFYGSIELGTVIAIMSLLGHFNTMIRRLGGFISNLQRSLSGTERIQQLFNESEEKERYNVKGTKDQSAVIDLEDILFSYKEKPVINSLTLKVKGGQAVALVGPSGGGKSTIIKLLLGFYPPKSGRISVKGKPLKEYSLWDLRSQISYVPQDSYMFDGTIKENILFGKPEASMKDVEEAAQAANAHSFIMETPQGYNTMVGERGVRLSGGQRQRIAIARAVLKNAPILLLDEATSSLDSQSEYLVQEAINRLMKGRSVLVIAHRLSTIEDADNIYVIDKGKVVESGTHSGLLQKQGTYKKLYDLQFNNQ